MDLMRFDRKNARVFGVVVMLEGGIILQSHVRHLILQILTQYVDVSFCRYNDVDLGQFSHAKLRETAPNHNVSFFYPVDQ